MSSIWDGIPNQDPHGRYRLVLLQKGWDDVLSSFESRDRWEVRDRLEQWLDQVNRAPSREALERWVRGREERT